MNLRRLLRYLYGTSGRLLTIGTDDISMMNIFVDASYAVHNDMKTYPDGCIIISREAIMAKSVKQKLTITRSTEAELVGCSYFLPSAIYARLFLDV